MPTVKNLPGSSLANAPTYRRTSNKARAYAFIRQHILVKGVDLSLLHTLDIQYIDTIVNAKIGQFPAAYTKPDARRAFRRIIKECIIQLFTLPKDLPYRIGECRIHNEFCIGLFVTKDTTTTEVAKALREHEPLNSEIVWNRKTSEDHDSCFMNKWIEVGKELERGGYRKEGFKDVGRAVEEDSRAYKAHCLIYGRLMFANHDDDGHFMFVPFQPITPSVASHLIVGKVTIDPQEPDIDRPLRKGDQILMYYDHDMEFDGNPGFSFLPKKAVEPDSPRMIEDAAMEEYVDDVEKDDDYSETPKKKQKGKGGVKVKPTKAPARSGRAEVGRRVHAATACCT